MTCIVETAHSTNLAPDASYKDLEDNRIPSFYSQYFAKEGEYSNLCVT